MPADPTTPTSDGHSLEYRGFRFAMSAEPVRGGYQPIVVLVRSPADEAEMQLPSDTEEIAYGTEAERSGTLSSKQCVGYMIAPVAVRDSFKEARDRTTLSDGRHG
jgi:hypothetical protein